MRREIGRDLVRRKETRGWQEEEKEQKERKKRERVGAGSEPTFLR